MKFKPFNKITERDADAKAKYLAENKSDRATTVFIAPCNDWSCNGLNMSYQAKDLAKLAEIRSRVVTKRLDRVIRKADFFMVLKRVIERRFIH